MAHKSLSWHFGLLFALWLAFISRFDVANAISQTYCSTENTAASDTGQSFLYQSNGNCQNQCSGYAFAVLQGATCWCSNTMPGSTQSVNDCSQACPGYPNDHCGSTSGGLFGYIALGVTPSSTAGGSASSTDPSDTTTASSSRTTSTNSHSPSTASAVTPVVSTITQSGVVITQTVSTSPTGQPMTVSKSKSPSNGLIAGVVIATVAAAFAIILASAYFCIRRHRSKHEYVGANGMPTSVSGLGSPQRPMSVSTNSMLLSGTAVPRLNITITDDDISPISAQDRRNSRNLDAFDDFPPVLRNQSDKYPVLRHRDDSRSSLGDHQDYSRRLEVTNPDVVDEAISVSEP